jgi:Ca2+-binding EF-hand superfamily protein
MGSSKSKGSMTPEDFDHMIKGTDFSNAEIDEWYQQFKADFPKGYISPKEFKAVYHKMFPKGDADKFCDHIFRIYDADKSKTISFQEFITTLHVSAHGTPQEKLRASFRMYDEDRNGFVTEIEIADILQAIYRSRNDPKAREKSKADAKVIMELDKNKDKKLSEEEFVSAAQTRPDICRMLQGAAS